MTFTEEQREGMRAAIRDRLRKEDLMRGEIVRLLGFSVRSADLPKILEACRESDRVAMEECNKDLAEALSPPIDYAAQARLLWTALIQIHTKAQLLPGENMNDTPAKLSAIKDVAWKAMQLVTPDVKDQP